MLENSNTSSYVTSEYQSLTGLSFNNAHSEEFQQLIPSKEMISELSLDHIGIENPDINCGWHQTVRERCKWITDSSRYVAINMQAIKQFAETIDLKDIEKYNKWDLPVFLLADSHLAIDYIFSLNALNFGSGFTYDWSRDINQSTFFPVADALANFCSNNLRPSAEWGAYVTEKEVAELIGPPNRDGLIKLYTESLNQLGNFVYTTYGTFSELISSLKGPKKAHQLINILIKNVPYYQDASNSLGFVIPFLKRAQILVQDLCLGLPDKFSTYFDDRHLLTAFADNALPQVLRYNHILQFTPDLSKQINNGDLIISGSQPEVEIRAATIVAVDLLSDCLSDLHGEKFYPYHIDPYLWGTARQIDQNKIRRHRTKSIFY